MSGSERTLAELERENLDLRRRNAELEAGGDFDARRRKKVLRVIENISDGFVLIDRNLKFSYFSTSFETFARTDPRILIGTSPFDIVHPDDRDEVLHGLERAVTHPGEIETIEFRGKLWPDKWQWIGLRVSNHFDDPDLESLVAVYADIHDRVVAEQELATVHSQLMAVANHTDEAILLSDEDAKPVFFNTSYAERLKDLLDIDMRPGLQPHSFLPPEMGAQWEAFHKRVLAGESFVAETEIPVSDGEVLAFETLFNPVLTDGRVTGFAEITREVTDRRRAEGEMRETSARMHALLSAIPAITYFKDINDQHLVVNAAFAEFFGIEIGEALGRTSDELYPHGWFEMSREADRMVLETGTAISVIDDEVVLDDDSRLYFESMKVPIYNAKSEVIGLVCISQDVTEYKRREEERLDLERQFQHVQKLDSLGALAGGVAHDFNNLLMAILGNVDLMQMEADPESALAGNLHEVEVAAQRASDLCRQLLVYSGRSGCVLVPCDLSGLVDEMVNLLAVSIAKKITLELDLSRDLPDVGADPTQISQVVMNLITNAAEAIGDAVGTIRVTTGVGESGEVFLEVCDSGTGMDESIRARIFDPFFTTKDSGRGLGLASVQGIINGHNGTISIDSEPRSGTTVRVEIPIARPGMLAEPEPGSEASDWLGSGRVLIVDDEPSVLLVARHLLERIGFDVQVAADGAEALEVLDRISSEIRLVLLDINMPRMGGLEVVREIRRRGFEIPVVLSSGRDEPFATVHESLGEQIAEFIHKPYRLEALRAVMCRVLG